MRRGRCRLRIACSRRHPRTTGAASAAAPRPLSSASHHAWPLPSPLAVLAPHSLTAWTRPPEGNLAPPPQPPMRFSWQDGGCRARAVVHRCDLIHLRPMVSVSLLLGD